MGHAGDQIIDNPVTLESGHRVMWHKEVVSYCDSTDGNCIASYNKYSKVVWTGKMAKLNWFRFLYECRKGTETVWLDGRTLTHVKE